MFQFRWRDQSRVDANPPPIDVRVKNYSHAAMWGPDRAELEVAGESALVWQFANMIGFGLDILDEHGMERWWGYLNEIRVRCGGVEFGVTLDDMANRVCVVYQDPALQDEVATNWAEDADSVEAYGKFELRQSVSMDNATLDLAEQQRDTILAERKWPIPLMDVSDQPGSGSAVTAALVCRGWGERCDKQMYSQPGGKVAFDDERDTAANVGDAGPNTYIAQSFIAGGPAQMAHAISAKVLRVGSPAGPLRINLHDDSGGHPGAHRDHADIAAADVATELAWIVAGLSDGVLLVPGARYWIVFQMMGANDGGNYYRVCCNDEGLFADGSEALWNGATWSAGPANRDLLFEVYGVRSVSDQIADMASASEIVTSTDARASSATLTDPYRDGSKSIKAEIEALAETGTANDVRLLVRFDSSRRLIIDEEPAPGSADYGVMRDGTVLDPYGVPVPAVACLAGVWVRQLDLIPAAVDVTRLVDLGRVFIESNEFDAAGGRCRPQARSVKDVWKG